MDRRKVGARYERAAAVFLESMGYEILERNFRCRMGEIDLIARQGGYLVFVEVKYRRDRRAGSPEEAVDRRKQRSIGLAARVYLQEKGLEEVPCRFDVAAVDGGEIRIIKDAFWL